MSATKIYREDVDIAWLRDHLHEAQTDAPLRIGIGLSWLAIVAAEMLTGGVGIGFFIWDAWNSSRLPDIIVALVYIGVVGFVLDRLVAGFGAFVKTSTDSKGFDLKVDYIPLRNLRFNVGVSKNDVQIKEIAAFAAPANPDPIRLLAQQNFVNAGGSSSRYLGKPSTDISKYTGTAFVRYEFTQTFLKNTWVMFATKYLGQREAELISVATATGAITIDRRLVPSHYLYDLNMGYRYKIGRYNTSFQLNLANLADDDKFYGAVWQTGRTYRLSANLNF